MEQTNLTPLALVEQRLNMSQSILAGKIGVSPVTVWRWANQEKGKIPQKYHDLIIKVSKERKIILSYTELLNGGVL